MRPYVEGRSVFDVGAGSGINRPDWMHCLIANVASEVSGIELDATLAERARDRGFDVITGDAETTDFGRTFDVVFAGEVIEHLSCPDRFLDNMRRHLAHDGVLIITTPNAFAVSNFVYRIGGQPRVNAGHVAWYDEVTIAQLLRRHAFTPVCMQYLRHRTPNPARAVPARGIRALLPNRLAHNTLLAVARPTD